MEDKQVLHVKSQRLFEVGPSRLHHTFLLGPARFIAQPLSALLGIYQTERDAALNVTGSNLLTKCFNAHAWR